jgi:type II secretory pathway predicted ATPase ExeA
MTTFEPDSYRPREPFHPSADPDSLFETDVIAEVLRRLLAALRGGAPLSVLTGPAGTGKTTLLRRLSAELERLGCQMVVESLPLALDEFRERLPAVQLGRRVAVCLDEAQALSKDFLEALDPLLTLRQDIRILLVGQPALETKLAELAARSAAVRESVRCRLAPLAPAEVRAYIECRWRAAKNATNPFAPEAVQRITDASGGVPQMINLMCSLALRLAETRGLDQISVDIVDEATRDLPSREPRHRVRRGARPAAPPASRGMRAAMVAAVVIPPLLVSAALLLRPAPFGPEQPRLAATPVRNLPAATESRPVATEPRPAATEPRLAAALTPEPTSFGVTVSDALRAPRRSSLPMGSPAANPPAATVTPALPASEPPAAPAQPGPPASEAATLLAQPSPPTGRASGPSMTVVSTAPMLPPRAMKMPPPVPPVARREPVKDEALLRRSEHGDLRGVQALLADGASPEARDSGGFTPLMFAAIHGNPAMLDALIAGGARVNVQNRAGLTPLMLAAINNHTAVLRALIDHGADMSARTRAGWTALTYAAWRGHAGIVRVLLARGADPNVTDREGWTILQYATWRAAEPIASDDLPEPPAGAGRPTANGAGHSEVVALLRQAGVRR